MKNAGYSPFSVDIFTIKRGYSMSDLTIGERIKKNVNIVTGFYVFVFILPIIVAFFYCLLTRVPLLHFVLIMIGVSLVCTILLIPIVLVSQFFFGFGDLIEKTNSVDERLGNIEEKLTVIAEQKQTI